jgi:hypothetical protein
MGVWQTGAGLTAQFREDGTCDVDGENAYYFVPNIYAIYTGNDPDDLNYAYEIVSYGTNYLTLRNVKTKTLYRFTRVEE